MPPIVEMKDVTKIYPNGVLADDRVNFSVEPGEIHALVGENGAGKSTLMKVLYGLEQPTEGQIMLRGQPVHIRSPHRAIALGIGMVHQNFMLVPSFTVAQNIVLGQEPERNGFVDAQKAIQIADDLAGQYGLRVDATATIDSIPVGMRQRVEILKTLFRGAEILILDEPTAVLTPQETDELFAAVRELVKGGKTVIFITHKLREVKEISDRVTVMRDAQVVGTLKTQDATVEQMARMMVGREVFLTVNKAPCQRGEQILQVRGLSYISETGRQVLRNVTFNCYAGEVLGIAGVEGNGQTELVEVLTGLRNSTRGETTLGGVPILNHDPLHVRQAGAAHIPEDRLTNGVALLATVEENLIVDRYFDSPLTRGGWYTDPQQVTLLGNRLVEQYDIRVPDGKTPVGSLSGGNMQKVVVARELSRQPKLLVAAQPTRGIDVGATEFVHAQLIRQRDQGAAVLLVSADLSEVMALSDRLAVMHNGEIVAVFPDARQATEEELGLYMLGIKRQTLAELEAHL